VDDIIRRFRVASGGFAARLADVQAGDWERATPCTEWNVRQLVNHVTRGNFNYAALVRGAGAADFLRMRDVDALGGDPAAAFERSADECADAFDGVSDLMLDYPLGRIRGAQALAVRTTDTVVHTWDLARAIGGDERLDPDLVAWIDAEFDVIYAGLAETPVSADTTHRFFKAPTGTAGPTAQKRLLYRMGR
jgi:uncharacterized protein (TIGR03086 family)